MGKVKSEKIKVSSLIIIYLFFSSTLLFAQSKKGSIEGIVRDGATKEVMAYTTVILDGTTIGTISDTKGFYSIKLVTPGTYKLKASFVGYEDTTYTVVVAADKVTTQDIDIVFSSVDLQVVVTGQVKGQIKAINTQLAAVNIKNIVSEVKIRELPDANVAEALARLPGVSINRSGGEAVDVRIRGVGSNTMYINGMRMSGGLNSIATSMIGSIELNKAFLPDQDADVLGGSVDFKLREAAPGFNKDIEVRTGYNGFTKSFKMQDVTVLLSNRFFKDKLGVMLSLNYDRKDRGNDVVSVTYEPRGASEVGIGSDDVKPVQISTVGLTSTQYLNNRYGVTLFSDYKLNNGRLVYNGFFSSLESQYGYGNNTYTNAELGYYSTSGRSISTNLLNGIGGDHKLFGAQINWGVSYSHSISKTPEQFSYHAQNQTVPDDIISIDSTTTINEYMALSHHDITKTFTYTFNRDNNESLTNEFDYKLDVEVPFNLGDKINGYIKFGGKGRNISRAYNSDDYSLNTRNEAWEKQMVADTLEDMTPEITWVKLPTGNYSHNAVSGDSIKDFSMLGAKIYFSPDFNKVEYVLNQMDEFLGHYISSDANDYENSEQFYAGYIMSGINLGKMITFTPGVRYEYNKYSTTARSFEEGIANPHATPEQQGVFKDTTGGADDKHWFPMIHFKFKPLKWFDVRLSYTHTVSRPGFNNMSPRYYRDVNYNLSIGNVYLKPQNNTNYDIYLSFYTGKIGLFTLGAFYKVVENQVRNYSVVIIDPAVYGLDAVFKGKNYDRMINNSKPGYVKGLELDWQTQFSFLPGFLNGIVLNANMALMQSYAKYPFYSFETYLVYDEFGKPKSPFKRNVGKDDFRSNKLAGMPNMTWNISLGYEKGGFSGRVSAYHQSATIENPNILQRSLDEDKDHLTRIDVRLSQKLKKVPGLIFYLSLNNLTNNPDRTMLTYYPEKTIREERYGASGDIGVRYKF